MGGGGTREVDVNTKALCKKAIKGAETWLDYEDNIFRSLAAWDTSGDHHISLDELTVVMQELNPAIKHEDVEQVMSAAAGHSKAARLDYFTFVSFLTTAPHLPKYFEENQKILKEFMTECLNMLKPLVKKAEKDREGAMSEMGLFNERVVSMQPKYREKYRRRLLPIIQKSFAYHDKDGSGVLERDESVIFFSNYIDRLSYYVHDTLAANASAVGSISKMLDPQEMATQFNEQVDTLFHDLHKDREARVREAFAVVDINKDLRLQESEVIEALTTGSEKNTDLFAALGLQSCCNTLGLEMPETLALPQCAQM